MMNQNHGNSTGFQPLENLFNFTEIGRIFPFRGQCGQVVKDHHLNRIAHPATRLFRMADNCLNLFESIRGSKINRTLDDYSFAVLSGSNGHSDAGAVLRTPPDPFPRR